MRPSGEKPAYAPGGATYGVTGVLRFGRNGALMRLAVLFTRDLGWK